jgi:hypothetical protein
MASTPQTRGFQVSAMPGYQLANPSFFNPYGNIAQGLQSGMSMGNQLAEILYRRQQQQQQQALQPLQRQLLEAQVASAQQRSAVPDIVWGDSTDVDTSRSFPAAMEPVMDESGQPMMGDDGQPMFRPSELAPDIEYGDIIRTTKGTKYLPGGLSEPVEKKTTVKLAKEREAEAANRESLIGSREAAVQAAQDRIALQRQLGELKAETDRIKAQAAADRAAAFAENPNYQHRSIERGGKKFIQYFRRDDPTKVVHEVDAGAFNSSIFAPGAVFNAPGAAAGVPAPAEGAPADDLTAILGGKYGTTPQASAPAPVAAVPAALAPVRFNVPQAGATPPVVETKEQWAALPSGTTYLGVDGKTYIKR